MSKKLFTEDEIEQLKRHPCVEKVTTRTVSFTPEFKTAYRKARQNGQSAVSILKQYAIPTDILGTRRLLSLDSRIVAHEGEFRSGRTQRQRAIAKTDRERIAQLEAQLAYTREELEFLKKLSTANMEARIAWESKRRRG